MPDIIKKLQAAELETLANLESVIKRGLKTFTEVGSALLAIRDGRLYREDFKTFEEYCNEKWGFSRPKAYQLMDAANVIGNLSTIVDKPTNEAQARPLAALPPDKQSTAWKAATDTAKAAGVKVTAKVVQAEVEKLLPPKPPKPVAAPAKEKPVATIAPVAPVQPEQHLDMMGNVRTFPKNMELSGACRLYIYGEPSIHFVRIEKMVKDAGINLNSLRDDVDAAIEKHVKMARRIS